MFSCKPVSIPCQATQNPQASSTRNREARLSALHGLLRLPLERKFTPACKISVPACHACGCCGCSGTYVCRERPPAEALGPQAPHPFQRQGTCCASSSSCEGRQTGEEGTLRPCVRNACVYLTPSTYPFSLLGRLPRHSRFNWRSSARRDLPVLALRPSPSPPARTRRRKALRGELTF